MLIVYLTTLFLAPQVWLPPFVGLPVDYIIYPIWLVVTIIQRRWMPKGLRPADLMFLFVLGWLVLTTLANGFHPGQAWRSGPSSIGFIINYTKFFLLFQFMVGYAKDLRRVEYVGRWLLVFAGILVVESIQQKLVSPHIGWAGQSLGWTEPEILAAGGTGRTRWIHIFDGPGVFCVIFTTALPFALFYLDKWQSTARKVFGAAASLALLVAIYFTGSRGGFLATLAMLALYIALRYRVSIFALIIGAGLSAVLFVAAPSQLTTMRDESRSAEHRIDMWAEGIEMATQNPVFGIGRGNFGRYSGTLIAHNSAVELMGETGFVGLFFWVGLIYFSAKGAYRAYMTTENVVIRSLMSATLISLAGYVVSSMFVTLEYETFYILLGLCSAAGIAAGQRVVLTGKDLALIVAIIGIWFVLLKVAVMAY